jgi:hypothetical protein
MIFTLGSMAVGGSPFGPLGKVGEVVSELNQNQEAQQVQQARVLVDRAWLAARQGDEAGAASLLRQAKSRLRGVEDPEARRVMANLHQVETAISTASPPDPLPTPAAPPAVHHCTTTPTTRRPTSPALALVHPHHPAAAGDHRHRGDHPTAGAGGGVTSS